MASCTAIIDIGSNSMRMAVFQKTSRFAFHIIHEVKSSVRLGEHAYKNGGNLQPLPMERTALALGEFLTIAKSFDARKVLCVATSALRDAPNSNEFISRIRREHSLSIKIIDGAREAYLGGMACANLLAPMEAITVDVGGGSSEFAHLCNGKVESMFSLNIGTVRIKELFLDNNDTEGAIRYIDEALKSLPPFQTDTLVGIGGTFRALTRALMKRGDAPLKKLHGFTTGTETFSQFGDQILQASPKKLKSLYIKPDRFDTIKPGTLILLRILKHLQAKKLICSGVGVREGVFLSDMLRNARDRFPANYNPSVRYLLDTYAVHSDHGIHCAALAKRLFELLKAPLQIDESFRYELVIAAKLLPIGVGIRYYNYRYHSHYLVLSALDYTLTHHQIALIAHLLLFKKGHTSSELIAKSSYRPLLPDTRTLNAIHTILWLSHTLLAQRQKSQEIALAYQNGALEIQGEHLYLAREKLKDLPLPKSLTLTFL
ncbi:MAG: Ppx/GppA family phosphatase [Sulfuricurvum sp.]|jgi:exopolyphosphatase/guanosine-5'-triphosphate,3'-diphosphate pyrophosphatase|uniref:Ppx/GppA phosphatase family protein n=1 Tax=Sulfuricurvum sp. TaxID=2025608 RepID=UPI0025DB427D|nr:Ppx/GppA phosphatase family protein [Sulfuricurvum sp.]MCK9373144.1 Ppx/GppA family phosphatase [Sulfuricurvum sp.]